MTPEDQRTLDAIDTALDPWGGFAEPVESPSDCSSVGRPAPPALQHGGADHLPLNAGEREPATPSRRRRSPQAHPPRRPVTMTRSWRRSARALLSAASARTVSTSSVPLMRRMAPPRVEMHPPQRFVLPPRVAKNRQRIPPRRSDRIAVRRGVTPFREPPPTLQFTKTTRNPFLFTHTVYDQTCYVDNLLIRGSNKGGKAMNIAFGADGFEGSSAADMLAAAEDPSYLAQLERDPHAALRSRGIEVPQEIEIIVLKDSDEVVNVLMPPDPNRELDDEALVAASGAGSSQCATTLLSCICSLASSI